MNTKNNWKQSEYQTARDEWLIKQINDTTFELIEFQPFKGANYHQYGGSVFYYKIDLNNFTREEIEKGIAPNGSTLEDEDMTNEFIAELLCDEWVKGIEVKELYSNTIDGLSELLKELGVNFKAVLNTKNSIHRIEFHEL